MKTGNQNWAGDGYIVTLTPKGDLLVDVEKDNPLLPYQALQLASTLQQASLYVLGSLSKEDIPVS